MALFSIRGILAEMENGGFWGGMYRSSVQSFPSYMKKTYRLKSRLDFQNVYTKGKSTANRAAVLYVMPQKAAINSRVGFAAGKKLGNAVLRNRVKRRIKEAVRLLWPRVKPGFSLILIARHAAIEMEFTQLCARLEELFERVGVLQKRG